MKKKLIKKIGWERSYQRVLYPQLVAYLGISCQNISKDFGYRFIGT